MKLALTYLAYAVLVGFVSGMLYWITARSNIMVDYKLGNLWAMWGKFNEGFALAAGFGVALLMVIGLSKEVEPESKAKQKTEAVSKERA